MLNFLQEKRPTEIPDDYPPPSRPGSLHPSQTCDGIIDCTLDNSDEPDNCPSRFNCAAQNAVSIPVDQVCDGFPDCDDESDETDCANRFYCPALGNTKVLRVFFLHLSAIYTFLWTNFLEFYNNPTFFKINLFIFFCLS